MGFLRNAWRRTKWAFTSSDKKDDLMQKIRDYIGYDARVAQLMKAAEADGVDIHFSSSLIGTSAAAQHVLDFSTGKQYIRICPYGVGGNLYSVAELASSLAHELRHYWQYKQLGATPKNGMFVNKNPRLAFIFNRVAEADAFSYECSFRHNAKMMQNFAVNDGASLIESMHEQGFDKEQVRIVMDRVYSEKRKSLQGASSLIMQIRFLEILSETTLAAYYDPPEARRLHAWHTAPSATPRDFAAAGDRELTLREIKGLVASYMPPLKDAQFEKMVLKHAHGYALETVNLMTAFARASASNDNQTAESLRIQVCGNICELKRELRR